MTVDGAAVMERANRPGVWMGRGRPDALEVEGLAQTASAARSARGDLAAAVGVARELGGWLPSPGAGSTALRWSVLATLGAVDLTVARVVEPHVDALAIIDELGDPEVSPDACRAESWGVYAAEGPGARLTASPTQGGPGAGAARWRLDGVKPWCSLAGALDRALVTAWVDEERRGLFAVALRERGVAVQESGWVSHGLPTVRSTPVEFDGVEAVPVGGPGWYLQRDGFAWGGIGVAAVWLGGAIGIARRIARQAEQRELDQIGWMHLGRVDAALHAASSVLSESARAIDDGRARGQRGALLASRVRQVVADAVETTIQVADHALGPAPLALDAEHAARVSDLRVYVRQHHAERDLAALGRAALAAAEDRTW